MVNVGRQSQAYDKIFKENMRLALPGLLGNIFKLDAVTLETLVTETQQTIERRPDMLQKVKDPKGRVYLFHVEYQTNNDHEMIYRMAEYYALLLRKHKLPIKQYVLYLGTEKLRMETAIVHPKFRYSYTLISLIDINYKVLLKSKNVGEKIFALLGKFDGENTVQVIEKIVQQVIHFSGSDLETSKYLKQLRILTQLRKLETQFNQVMESISTFFKEERDFFYKRGLKKGIEKGIERGIEKGIQVGMKKVAQQMLDANIPIEQIMSFTHLTKDEIEIL